MKVHSVKKGSKRRSMVGEATRGFSASVQRRQRNDIIEYVTNFIVYFSVFYIVELPIEF